MPVSKKAEPFSFQSWCQKELTRLLGFPVGDDLFDYLVSIETKKDVKEYLEELLGTDSKASRDFQMEFFKRWHPPERAASLPSREEAELLTELVRPKEDEMVLFADKRKKKKDLVSISPPPGFGGLAKIDAQGETDANRSKLDSASVSYDPILPKPVSRTHHTGLVVSTGQPSHSSKQQPPHTKKMKYVPLLSAEGQSRTTVQLPGRYACHCLAQKHALINNCTECGRIVCAQEGTGPCLFCGVFVCTPEDQELFNRDSKKGKKFRDQYMKKYEIKDGDCVGLSGGEGLHKAMELKQKLLEFEQTSVSRTKVIDDEMDYFSVDSNRWITHEDKKKLRAKEEELRRLKYDSRGNKAITLDFAGRKVIEDPTVVDIYREEHAAEALGGSGKSTFWKSQGTGERDVTHAGNISNPAIPIAPPEYQETHKEKRRRKKHEEEQKGEKMKKKDREQASVGVMRLQDSALQEMKDEGRCLSMHQPWASLLVAGIKQHEGRSWYSAHRGRLWIAATAKDPRSEDIKKVEDFYRAYYQDISVAFPSEYPTSCLLGCVDMVDCLPKKDYCEQYPGGESESPFVFIMENPGELAVKFPIKGQRKIWKLDTAVHLSAKRQGCIPSLSP